MKIDLNMIMNFFYVFLGSSVTFPWIVEFVSKKVTGKLKVALMWAISLIFTLALMWKQEFFVHVNWSDVPVALLSASAFFGAWSTSWKMIFHDMMNPLKPVNP